MKRILLLTCLLIISLFLNGQIVIKDGRYVWSYYCYKGIPFKLLTDKTYSELATEYYTRPPGKSKFDGKRMEIVYYINDIPISEHNFSTLKLKKREYVVDSNYYTEDVINDSVVLISLHAVVNLPIYVEGIEYSYPDAMPTETLQNRNLCFRKKRYLFEKNKIIVETK